MVENKIIELMHRELDGLNSAKQSTRLAAYLAGNREARQFFDELKGMSQALQEIEQVEPPTHLKHAIANALPHNRYPLRQARLWAKMTGTFSKLFEHRPALAFSSGLGLGVAAMLLFVVARWQPAPLDPAAVTGTMVSQNHPQIVRTLTSATVDHDGLKGMLALRSSQDETWLELALETDQSIEVGVALESHSGFFKSVSSEVGPFAGEFGLAGTSLRFAHRGNNRYLIGINGLAPESVLLHLQILRDSQVVYARRISGEE